MKIFHSHDAKIFFDDHWTDQFLRKKCENPQGKKNDSNTSVIDLRQWPGSCEVKELRFQSEREWAKKKHQQQFICVYVESSYTIFIIFCEQFFHILFICGFCSLLSESKIFLILLALIMMQNKKVIFMFS